MHAVPILSLLLLTQEALPAAPQGPVFDLFGVCIDSAGDVNGDRIPDLWVGDPSLFPPSGQDSSIDQTRGRAWCISGKDGSSLLHIDAPPGSWRFGWTIAGIGDTDGDGRHDVVVGCPQYDAIGAGRSDGEGANSPAGKSAVHLFSGRDGSHRFAVPGPAEQLRFAWHNTGATPTLASIGDWNGDGAADFALGQPHHGEPGVDAGLVQVLSGRDGSELHAWNGLEAYDCFGISLAPLPDLDGDGRSDLAAGAVPDWNPGPDEPEVRRRVRSGYVRILSSQGTVLRTLYPFDGSRCFGVSLAVFPPGSKRESPELLVGQPFDEYTQIAVTRWRLSDGQSQQWISKPLLEAWNKPLSKRVAASPGTPVPITFATRVLAVPDRDGDGRADVLVTAPEAFSYAPAGVLSSDTSEKRPWFDTAVVLARVELGPELWPGCFSYVGNSVCAMGDVDGDGVEDFALSGASVRCGSGCVGVVSIVSGKTLREIRSFTRPARD